MALNLLLPEQKFMPALMALKECLCEELAATGAPEPCFCGVVPAGTPPFGVLDCSKNACGVAWVSPVATFPSRNFPEPDETGIIPCNSPLAMSISVGVARCHPRPDGRQAQADPQAYFESTMLYLSDMAAMRRAILCCTKQNRDLQVSLGTWEAIEPVGGVSGGIWSAVIG